MPDIYERLEELDGITRVLISDVEMLHEDQRDRSPDEIDGSMSAIRRSYVRNVFALIEGLLEQHKCLLLDLSDLGIIALNATAADTMREKKRFMRFEEKLKTVFTAAADSFGHNLVVDFSSTAWEKMLEAIKVRNRITHPKSFLECSLAIWDLEVVELAEAWFKAAHNEFVRAASAHRAEHGWKS